MPDFGRGKSVARIQGHIKEHQRWLKLIESVSLGTPSRIDTIDYAGNKGHRIAIPRGFNPQSLKCEVLSGSYHYSGGYGDDKQHWESVRYEQIRKITPVELEDLPLHVSDKYKSHLFEETLKNA